MEIANLSPDQSMPFPPKSPMDLQADLSYLFSLFAYGSVAVSGAIHSGSKVRSSFEGG